MPFAKCKFYELDGTPIKGGCRRAGGGCAFVHPSHRDWSVAPNPRIDSSNAGGGRGGGGLSLSAGSGAPPSSSMSGWNSSSSGWGEAGSSWTETPKAETIRSGGWGDAWTEASKVTSNESNGWSSSTATGSGWGNASTEDSIKPSGGWADTAMSMEYTNWGSSSGGWDASETAANTNESQRVADASDQQNQDTNEVKQSALSENVTPRQQPDDVKMQDVPPSAASHRSSFSVGSPKSPTRTDKSITTRTRSSRHKMKEPEGPTERRDAWKLYVKTIVNAVRAQIALDNAEEKRDLYKRVQSSSQFEHIGALGRRKLDDDAKALKQTILRRSKELSSHVDTLEQLPEMSQSFLDFCSNFNEQQIRSYIAEAISWMEGVRPLVLNLEHAARALTPEISSEVRGRSVEDGQINDDSPISSPMKRRHSSPEPDSPFGVFARLSRAEELVDEMHDGIHLRMRATTANQVVQDTVDKMRAIQIDDSTKSDPVLQLSNKADELGTVVTLEAEKTAAALTRQGEMDQELAALRQENQKLIQNEALRQQREADMRKSMDEHSAHLRQMEEQMQQLLAQRQAPPPFRLTEATLAQVRAVACENVNEKVDPAIINFGFGIEGQIKDQHKEIYHALWQRLEPSLRLTERIYQWLESQIQQAA